MNSIILLKWTYNIKDWSDINLCGRLPRETEHIEDWKLMFDNLRLP